MRAVVLEDKGGPEVLTVRDVPEPEPGPEEVLVKVRATALNRADLLQRMGFYPGPPMEHEIPGMEFSGTVVGMGSRVAERSVGDARFHAFARPQVLLDRPVREEPGILEYETNVAFARRGEFTLAGIEQRFAVEDDMPAVGAYQSGQRAEQRTLAATRRPEDAQRRFKAFELRIEQEVSLLHVNVNVEVHVSSVKSDD